MNIKTMNQNERIDQQEWLALQVSLHFEKLMKQQRVNRSQLAKRLGTDKSYVTKLLDGANLTLRSIADVMMALDSSLVVDTMPFGFQTSIRPLGFDLASTFVRCELPKIEGCIKVQYASNWTEVKPDSSRSCTDISKVCA